MGGHSRKITGGSPGKPGKPLSREDLLEKFDDCVRETLGGDQARGLVATIDSLENLADVGELIRRASVD